MNAAARFVAGLRSRDHVTAALRDLHWLKIDQRITFKLCVLMHSIVYGYSPQYMADMATSVSSLQSRTHLRSASVGMFDVPRTLIRQGSQAFSVAGPRAWNTLPTAIKLLTCRGALSMMKTKMNTNFIVFHCMADKLELAVHDVLKVVTELEHFRMFVDTLYSHFSRSPKNQNELKAVAEDLHVQLRKVVRTFDVRWVASSFRSVCAIWQSYPALVGHFQLCSSDSNRNARERAKCKGLYNKLTQWFFVAELAIIKDALEPIKSLSLYFQTREASVITADAQISTTIDTLKAMKTDDGLSTLEFFDEFRRNNCFRDVPLKQPSDAERKKFCELKAKFFQGLVDNLSARFRDAGSTMHDATVLQKEHWPKSAEARILFGDREIVELCKSVKLLHGAAAIVHQYRLLKNGKASEAGVELQELNQRLSVLPISSAKCERSFSCLNLTHIYGTA